MPDEAQRLRLSSRNNCPCRDCSDRYTACSDKCKKKEFIEWKTELRHIKENRKAYIETEHRYNYKTPLLTYKYKDYEDD